MLAAAHQLALVLAVVALADAARCVAARIGARGPLETIVVAAAVGAAIAGAWSLALALVALGGSPVALLAGALLTWVAIRGALPESPAAHPVGSWLSGRGPLYAAAALGAGAAWVAWLVKYPELGIDSITYHLPEPVMWVQQGTPGSVELIAYELPHGNYPVTNELLVSWLLGLSHSFAPALLWTPLMAVLLALAGWLGLRRLDVAPVVAGLTIAGVILVPVTSSQILGPHTDLPAITWLVVSAALCAVAVREERAELLAPALLAAALGVGTKTTAGPLSVAMLAVAGWQLRHRLRPVANWLAAAAVAGVAVGGVWYVRNWVDHGSPLWPFVKTPGGDPLPRLLELSKATFLQTADEALAGPRAEIYFDILAGGLVALVLGYLAPVARRTKLVVGMTAASVVATIFWLNAPFTGVPDDPRFDVSLTTTRYLAPAMAAAAVAAALAYRTRLAAWTLGFAALLSLDKTLDLPFRGVPSLGVFVAGAVAGVGLLWASRRYQDRLRGWLSLPAADENRLRAAAGTTRRGAAAGVLAALALTVIGHGFAARHGGVGGHPSGGAVRWMAANPRFQAGEEPVAFAPLMVGVLAGDDLSHPISLIPAAEPCDRVRARLASAWVVVGIEPLPTHLAEFTAKDCLAGVKPAYDDAKYRVYAPGP